MVVSKINIYKLVVVFKADVKAKDVKVFKKILTELSNYV